MIWEFPKIKGTYLGVPSIRTIVYWGLYWGKLILGNYNFNWSFLISISSRPETRPLWDRSLYKPPCKVRSGAVTRIWPALRNLKKRV